MSYKDLRDSLVETPAYRRFKSVLAGLDTGGVTVDVLIREARDLHAARPVRTMFSKTVSPSVMQKAVLEDLSNRSRLVEMKVTLLSRLELVSLSVSLVKNTLQTQFSEQLKELGSTAVDRKAIVDRLVQKGTEAVTALESAIQILDEYIKDLDQASFALGRAVKVMEILLDKREAYEG